MAMANLSISEEFEIKPLDIVGQYNVQRFKQFSPENSANFYITPGVNTKGNYCMYPTMGRKHINYGGLNRLIFSQQPRAIFKTVNYWYAVVGSSVFRIDKFYNQKFIGSLLSYASNVYFDFLVVNKETFVCFVDDQKIYIYREIEDKFDIVTDTHAPGNIGETKPGFIIAFGNRIAVSVENSSQFYLSAINLGGDSYNKSTCFTINSVSVSAQETGIIRQFAVLSNTLFIFTDFTTGIWSNTPSVFTGTGIYFPWNKNTSYNWNFGISDPLSLDVGFDRITFLAQNKDGLLQVMSSLSGADPKRISSKAIDVLFQKYIDDSDTTNPFSQGDANGFMYEYENSVFYRLAAGQYGDDQILDNQNDNNCIEYSFETDEWHRVIELNGQRNRIEQHVYFNNQHLVTVQGENTVYQMGGQFYTNEIRNSDIENPQDSNAYLTKPFRYERITSIIYQQDYSEFETEYVEIDFVFGESNINFSETDSENTYNYLFKPSIELYCSDDSGISFFPADVREFSQMGIYQWKMRWYQLGCSRNRVYKLVCISGIPIIVLGAVMIVRRVSGGAN